MTWRLIALGLATWIVTLVPAAAQDVSLQIGEDGSLAVRGAQLVVLLTLLSLVPGILVMVTCFPFIVTVLAILRQALGLMQSPPNMLIVSLGVVPDLFRDGTGFRRRLANGIVPLNDGKSNLEEAFLRAH